MVQDKEKRVYEILENLNISYKRKEHPPVYTVEEAWKNCGNIPGVQCKNLFLRDRKGKNYYLVILIDSKRADLKKIASHLGVKDLSFASEERLGKILGLSRGSVTPFGLINDTEKIVHVLLDEELKNAEQVSFHPNVNTSTITICFSDFEKFLNWCGNDISYEEI